MKNLHTRKTSKGSNFGWLIRQMSINQTVGGRRFVEGLYQALFSFCLARRNVLTKRNENWAWFLVTCPHADTTRPRYFETANSPFIFLILFHIEGVVFFCLNQRNEYSELPLRKRMTRHVLTVEEILQFPDVYHTKGILSLPYCDIVEPFEAW